MKPKTAPYRSRITPLYQPHAICKSARQVEKVRFYERRPVPLSKTSTILETCFNSLKTPPATRSSWQIDSIMAVMMQWPSFLSLANSEYQYRELCQIIELSFYDENTILTREGGNSNEMYIVFSGQVQLFRQIKPLPNSHRPSAPISDEYRPDSSLSQASNSSKLPLLKIEHPSRPISSSKTNRSIDPFERIHPVSPKVISLLQTQINRNYEYELIDVKNEKDEFGRDLIEKSKSNQYTAVITKPNYLLVLYPDVYRMSIKLTTMKEIATRASFLKQVHEFESIRQFEDSNNLFNALAETLTEMAYPKGQRSISTYCDGWMIIKKGCLGRRRMVDFEKTLIDPRTVQDDLIGFNFKFPHGEQHLQTDEFGPFHCVADPSLSEDLSKPFSFVALEDTVVYIINQNALTLLPIDIRRTIEKIILDDPNDDTLVREWYTRERKVKWEMFKQSSYKLARQYIKQDKVDNDNSFPFRKPKPPRTIRKYKMTYENPRNKARVTFQISSE